MSTSISASVKVADEVWIATALLHVEQPDRADFKISEILDRAEQEGLTGELRPGVQTHVMQHCVANKKPNPGAYRTLTETRPGYRRLYRTFDPVYAGREHGKIMPDRYEIPERYEYLLEWYSRDYAGKTTASSDDPLLRLRGTGKGIYGDPDEYVREMREGWE
jgi:hypothetical protein